MQHNNQDVVLLELLRNGSVHAFTEVYHKYNRFLMTLAIDMLKDEDKAQDVMQEFFLDFWQKKLFLKIDIHYQNRDSASVMKGYLYASIRNRCLNKITRERKFSCVIPDEPFEPADPMESKEIYSLVSKALKKKVPPKSSTAFRLRHYEEKSHKEIAEEMNTSIQTVKNQIGTAVKILRGYFTPAHL